MKFNTIEQPADLWEDAEVLGEEYEDQGLEIRIQIELERAPEPEPTPVERPPEYAPQDNYLEKELERQRQEEIEKMAPKRLP